jgi:hypothetical protein
VAAVEEDVSVEDEVVPVEELVLVEVPDAEAWL